MEWICEWPEDQAKLVEIGIWAGCQDSIAVLPVIKDILRRLEA